MAEYKEQWFDIEDYKEDADGLTDQQLLDISRFVVADIEKLQLLRIYLKTAASDRGMLEQVIR